MFLYFHLRFSVKMSHHTNIDENIDGFYKFQAWKYRISLVLEENELDSYISGEVPVPEGDEAKGSRPRGSTYTTCVFPKET